MITFKDILRDLQKEAPNVEKKARKVPLLCPKCKENPAGAYGACIYDVEINEGNTLCYCCKECRNDCAENV